ncbi:MAG: hypothetical protein IPK82_40090 [Polyangiaceae bacterium]|nr:hypothetical protein [Polyangiaceae bacterium]
MAVEALLAGIIAVSPPGQSPYSMVPLPSCGENPLKPACVETPKPIWSPLYSTFVRQENREEALKRYLDIARAIEKVADDSTKPTTVGDVTEPAIWPWSAEDLARSLATIAYHESGYRRDVQTGIGKSALGDCGYWGAKGQKLGAEEARATGAQYLCRSVCLVQINTGGLSGQRYGMLGKDMVGLDSASLQRCFSAGARAFANARGRCATQKSADWFTKTIASYGTGKACETEESWVSARVSTFEKLSKLKAGDLAEDVKKLLGLQKTESNK